MHLDKILIKFTKMYSQAKYGSYKDIEFFSNIRNEQAAVIGDALTNRLLGGQRIGGATGGMEGGCHDESFCLKGMMNPHQSSVGRGAEGPSVSHNRPVAPAKITIAIERGPAIS